MIRTVLRFLSIVAILLSASCGPAHRPPEPDNLYWPLPPDQPRIKYLQSIYSEDDIDRVYTLFEKIFGKEYDDTISRPYGIYCRREKLYVTDIRRRVVLIFDFALKRLTAAAIDGNVQTPASAVSDSVGRIYITDAGSNRVAVYNAKGRYQTAFIIADCRPVALAINESLGRLYVVDRRSHRVVVLNLEGKILFSFGGQGNADGQFNIPLAIALDRSGDVYVVDNGNFRVQHFTPEGVFISKFGSVGDRPGMFANPKGIALDSEDHIYVTDAAYSNFQIFDREGNILLAVGSLGPDPGFFHLPAGISIDEHDRIYIADQLNARVEVFQYLKSP